MITPIANMEAAILSYVAAAAPLPGPAPSPNPVAPPGSDKFQLVLNWSMWIVMLLAVLGVLIVAAMMVVQNRRGEGGEHAQRLGFVLVGCILAGVAAGVVNALVG